MSSVIVSRAVNKANFLTFRSCCCRLAVAHHWPAIQVSHIITFAFEIDDSDTNNANERFAYNNKVNNKLLFLILCTLFGVFVSFIYSGSISKCYKLSPVELAQQKRHLHLYYRSVYFALNKPVSVIFRLLKPF